jgi:hypothetical protein
LHERPSDAAWDKGEGPLSQVATFPDYRAMDEDEDRFDDVRAITLLVPPALVLMSRLLEQRLNRQIELPSVSVVVPFYGADVSALTRCVKSLLNQDYSEDRVTITVVDNNETPRLAASAFGPRCSILHEPGPGSYAARNRGIRESLGEIIAFTDSDCVPQRSWITAGVRSPGRHRARHRRWIDRV